MFGIARRGDGRGGDAHAGIDLSMGGGTITAGSRGGNRRPLRLGGVP
jgi:hypothetical protein